MKILNKVNINLIVSTGLVLLTVFSSCKQELKDVVNTSITEPIPFAPANNTLINLSPLSNAVVTFEWETAKTGNHTMSFYEVEFDKENGDFSNPLYKEKTNRLGVENKLLLSHRIMNRIAHMAGIPELTKGKVKWRVMAKTGVVSIESESGTLELNRPEGTTDMPDELFLTGTATEGGTDLNKSIKFKKTADGVFEVYTALTPGTYTLVNKLSAEPLSFVLRNDLISSGTSANSPASTKTVYRINLDFNTASSTLTEIVSVGLWFSGYNSIKANLLYEADGVWRTTFNNAWKPESWGKDERYKFRVVEKDALGNLVTKSWGSSKKDNNRPTATQEASYFFLTSVDNTQYDYAYKFNAESINTEVQFKLNSSGDYTHIVIHK